MDERTEPIKDLYVVENCENALSAKTNEVKLSRSFFYSLNFITALCEGYSYVLAFAKICSKWRPPHSMHASKWRPPHSIHALHRRHSSFQAKSCTDLGSIPFTGFPIWKLSYPVPFLCSFIFSVPFLKHPVYYTTLSTPVVPWLSYSPLDPRFADSKLAGIEGFISERKNPE